jgi:hypothetical protein
VHAIMVLVLSFFALRLAFQPPLLREPRKPDHALTRTPSLVPERVRSLPEWGCAWLSLLPLGRLGSTSTAQLFYQPTLGQQGYGERRPMNPTPVISHSVEACECAQLLSSSTKSAVSKTSNHLDCQDKLLLPQNNTLG